MPNGGHHGEGEHDERDVAMPAVPGAGLVVVEAQLVFRGLEAIFDRPTMSLDLDQHLDACSGRAPGREEGQVSVGNVAADQQAARPQSDARVVVFGSVEIGQFAIHPVVQPRAFCAVARGQALPSRGIDGARDLFRRAGDRRFALPGAEVMAGM